MFRRGGLERRNTGPGRQHLRSPRRYRPAPGAQPPASRPMGATSAGDGEAVLGDRERDGGACAEEVRIRHGVHGHLSPDEYEHRHHTTRLTLAA